MAYGSRHGLDHGIASPPSTYPFPGTRYQKSGIRDQEADGTLLLFSGSELLTSDDALAERLCFLIPDT